MLVIFIFVFKVKSESSNINSILSGVHNGHLFPVHVQVCLGAFHKGMRVPAQNHVDIAGVPATSCLIHLNAQMRQAYYQIATFFVFQQSGDVVGIRAIGIFIDRPLRIYWPVSVPSGFAPKPETLRSSSRNDLKNDIRFYYIFEYCGIKIIVGTYYRETWPILK